MQSAHTQHGVILRLVGATALNLLNRIKMMQMAAVLILPNRFLT